MRIFAASDLHTDFKANRLLLEQLTRSGFSDDILILAGDIADRLGIIEDTLALLRERFSGVFYMPGNHELWVRAEPYDSLEKLRRVLEVCARLDVHTTPARAGDFWIVPLFSWYEEGFGEDDGIETEELQGWADFHFCKWPPNLGAVSEYFRELNASRIRPYSGEVITLSHFLPRRDLLPRVEKLRFKALPKVAGCNWLDTQIRLLNSGIHVFGHSHINCDRVIDGVRYVQNAMRYPNERANSAFSFKMVWPPRDASEVKEESS